jgi:hypothetical protein
MSRPDGSKSARTLDPWRVMRGCLFDLNSYDIPPVVDKAGMQVDWSLTDRENHSDKYRKDAYRPRIDAAYDALSSESKLRVCSVVARELAERSVGGKLEEALQHIGWRIESGQLCPADESVLELFLPRGSQHDAYVRIREILLNAKRCLRVIDPYLDGTIFAVLGAVDRSLQVDLLTDRPTSDFAREARKFEQQYSRVKIEIRYARDFHDRFMIIDNEECWHVGCSIKDAGNRAFMLNRVEDPRNRIALLNALGEAWSSARATA